MNLTSLEELEALAGQKEVQAVLRRLRLRSGGTYSEFMLQLYDDIDGVIFELQRSRQLMQNDSEDRITQDFLIVLNRQGYHATHDGMTGGHVDLSVQLGEHAWIAEAKKDGQFGEALLQLTTRYTQASGNFAHDHAGLLFYLVNTSDALSSLRRWRDHLAGSGHACVECTRNRLAFYSTHTLPGSGTDVVVRTMIVSLYHRPADRSGRRSASGKGGKRGKGSSVH